MLMPEVLRGKRRQRTSIDMSIPPTIPVVRDEPRVSPLAEAVGELDGISAEIARNSHNPNSLRELGERRSQLLVNEIVRVGLEGKPRKDDKKAVKIGFVLGPDPERTVDIRVTTPGGIRRTFTLELGLEGRTPEQNRLIEKAHSQAMSVSRGVSSQSPRIAQFPRRP